MRKFLVGLLFSICAGAANAQAIPLPDCWFSNVGGTGTYAVIGHTTHFRFLVWKCPETDTKPTWVYVLVSKNSFNLKVPAGAQNDMLGVAIAYWNANVLNDVSTSEWDEGRIAAYQAAGSIPTPVSLKTKP